MKLKGINPLERHVEKIVVGVVGVGALAAVALQFLVFPNEVEVSRGQTAGPEGVFRYLTDEANSLSGALNDPDPRLPPDVSAAPLGERFAALAAMPLNQGTPIAGSWGSAFETGGGGIADPGDVPAVAIFEPPAADDLIAAAQWVTIDPFFVERTSEEGDLPGVLAQALPDAGSGPLDVASVTVEASINGVAIEEALLDAPEGQRAMPGRWWRETGMGVLTVEAERQELRTDGTWSSPERVEGLFVNGTLATELASGSRTAAGGGAGDPHAAGPIESLADLTPEDMTEAVRLTAQDEGLVRRPPFPPVISGDGWQSPRVQARVLERISQRGDAQDINRQIDRLEEQIEREERLIDGQPRSDRPRGGGDDRQPGGRPGGRSGGRPAQPTSDDATDRGERNRERREQRITEYQEQIEELLGQLDDLGYDRDNQLVDAFGGDDDESGRASDGRGGLLDGEQRVWLHDLDVEPGATYRYRIRYAVNNPMFGKQRFIDSEDTLRMVLAEEPLAYSGWTEDWTEPVNVLRSNYIFFTNAAERGALGRATSQASVEVYRMYYGFYRRSVVSVTPGEPIVAAESIPSWLVAIDADEAVEDEVAAYINEINGVVQEWRGGNETIDDDDRDGADDAGPLLPAEQPEGVTFINETAQIMTGSAVLDVLARPNLDGGDRTRFSIVVLGPDGVLTVRAPDADTGSPQYMLVQHSAQRGETSLLIPPGASGPATGPRPRSPGGPPTMPSGSRPGAGPRDR